jgi:hypothetical protein
MLGVLKEDLSPKVHRADMSVLRKDLPLKKEFVISKFECSTRTERLRRPVFWISDSAQIAIFHLF